MEPVQVVSTRLGTPTRSGRQLARAEPLDEKLHDSSRFGQTEDLTILLLDSDDWALGSCTEKSARRSAGEDVGTPPPGLPQSSE